MSYNVPGSSVVKIRISSWYNKNIKRATNLTATTRNDMLAYITLCAVKVANKNIRHGLFQLSGSKGANSAPTENWFNNGTKKIFSRKKNTRVSKMKISKVNSMTIGQNTGK
ncbi:uncharacterized protein LOC114524086 [Dendronephthya gigantea]|nr:uncharacterized protein LOC114524086 [Dendronephthya gigantea]